MLTLFILLGLLRLALVAGRPMVFMTGLIDDDELFVQLAQKIEHGNWLGHYSQLTLMKGPGLSILIAALRFIGIGYEFTTQLMWCGACLLLLHALTRLARNALQCWVLFLVAVAVLFHPVALDAMNASVKREAPLYMIQTLAIFSGALLTVFAGNLRSRFRWGLFTGLMLGWHWITREEGIWIVPSMAMFLAWIFVAVLREQNCINLRSLRLSALAQAVAAVAIPILAACFVNYSICTINYFRYKLFCVVEFKVPDFLAAYGALARITPPQRIHYVPVTTAARRMAYQVSPTFRQLQPLLEGPLRTTWSMCSSFYLPHDHMSEMGGGHFMWALRDAVMDTSNAQNAAQAMQMYRKIGQEINDAIDTGKIPGGPRRDQMAPPIHRSDWPALADSVHHAVSALIGPGLLSMDIPQSEDSAEMLLFSDMLLTFPTPTETGVDVHIDGWVFDKLGRQVAVRFDPVPAGDPPEKIEWTSSPDLQTMPEAKGIPTSTNARFHLEGWTDTDSRLVYSIDGKDVASLDYTHGQYVLANPPIYAAVDSTAYTNQFGTTRRPNQKTLAEHLLNIRKADLALYQLIQPCFLALGALAFFATLAGTFFRRPGAGAFLMMSLILLVAMTVRVALLSYIDAMSFPAVNNQYLGPVYALIPLFIGLSFCGASCWLPKISDAKPATASFSDPAYSAAGNPSSTAAAPASSTE
jgi:hypothetical protein